MNWALLLVHTLTLTTDFAIQLNYYQSCIIMFACVAILATRSHLVINRLIKPNIDKTVTEIAIVTPGVAAPTVKA